MKRDPLRVLVARDAPVFCVMLLAVALASGCASEGDRTPDVLLITIDTLRADHLGTYGFELDTSPHIDALGERGVVFERAVAAAGKTVPSHASIMTSLYIREHSVGDDNTSGVLRGAVTLAERFQEAGYATGAFAGNILLTAFAGFGVGFDEYDCDVDTPERNRSHVLERIAESTTERALSWLESVGDSPVFLWVHYQDPHGPYTPPPELEGRFRVSPPPGERPLPLHSIPEYQRLPNLRRVSEYRSRYAEEIFYADRSVGKLLDAVDLHRGGRAPIVLLTSDHGESFGETLPHFRHFHSSAPEIAHIPMILSAPGISPGRRSEVVHHVDVMPTLLELADLPAPIQSSGVALGPVLRGVASLPDRYVYCDNGRELSAYRGDEIIRIRTKKPAAKGVKQGTLPKGEENYRWSRHAWPDAADGRGASGARTHEPLPADVAVYLRSAVPMVKKSPPSPKRVEELKALGYLSDK